MSIFREHKSIADRSAADRQRHKRLIDRAIKDSIKDVIAEESIIGQSGNKKIKIPVKGIKEYQFVYALFMCHNNLHINKCKCQGFGREK